MARTVKVHTLSTNGKIGIKEVSFQEAERILEGIYNDPFGGLVVDTMTGEVIWKLNPDVEEITIIDQMLGGG